VGRDDELRTEAYELMESRQEGKLPSGGEGSLGLVEYVEGVAMKAILQQNKERLPVRLLVERAPPECGQDGRTGSRLGIKTLKFPWPR
jgi:hypothetical protein